MQRRSRRGWIGHRLAGGLATAGMLLGSLLAPGSAAAVTLPAPGTISTVMGLGHYNGEGIPATSAALYNQFGQNTTDIAGPFPGGLAVAPDGTLYIADRFNHRVRKVSTAGTITTLAGTGCRASAATAARPTRRR